MGFDHDHQVGPRLAAALVNATARSTTHQGGTCVSGPAAHEPHHLLPALQDLLEAHGIRRPALTATATREIASWAERLRTVFVASDQEGERRSLREVTEEHRPDGGDGHEETDAEPTAGEAAQRARYEGRRTDQQAHGQGDRGCRAGPDHSSA